MGLSVIGAGFGRTGTMSLKLGLEALGVGRCHHMTEVFPNPAAPGLWARAIAGELGDWDEIFDGYAATTDWPACAFYRELAERYADAKVVLTVRDPDKWFDSTQETIFSDTVAAAVEGTPVQQIMQGLVWKTFDGRIHDRAHCIEVYERHNAEVRKVIPPGRLLVYDLAQGWAPLCGFLGLPRPDFPIPRANSRDEFHAEHLPELVRLLRG